MTSDWEVPAIQGVDRGGNIEVLDQNTREDTRACMPCVSARDHARGM